MKELYQQSLSRHIMSQAAWWLGRCIGMLLLYCFFTQPILADNPLVTQQIRYHLPGAGEVYLVWGVNGWQLLPEETRPAGTIVQDQVMHTLMTLEGDIFAATIHVPAGTTLDFGFQTRKKSDGSSIEWVWDGDYQASPLADEVIWVEARETLDQDQALASLSDIPSITQEFRYHMPEAGEVYLVWGFNGWQPAPKAGRSAGTVIRDYVMHTPMTLEGDTFTTKIQAFAGVSLDYGFQVRKRRDGTEIPWAWDGDYRLTPRKDNVTEVETKLVLESSRGSTTVPGSRLPLLIGLGLILAIGTIFVIRRETLHLGSLNSWRLVYLRDLLRELVVRDVKLRYKRSALGLGWSLINPLSQLLVLYFIFSRVIQLNVPNYPAFLFTGLLVWTWFQSSLFNAANVILENPDLIKRPGFPVAVLPIVTVITHLIHFLLALPILLAFLLFSRIPISPVILALPFILLLQFLLTLSLAYLVAAIHVTFRDTQYLLGIILLLGFYLSPIFYETSLIPQRFQLLYHLNPMVDLINTYRMILIEGMLPDYLPLLLIGAFSLVFLWVGYRIFVKVSYRFVEEL